MSNRFVINSSRIALSRPGINVETAVNHDDLIFSSDHSTLTMISQGWVRGQGAGTPTTTIYFPTQSSIPLLSVLQFEAYYSNGQWLADVTRGIYPCRRNGITGNSTINTHIPKFDVYVDKFVLTTLNTDFYAWSTWRR